MAVEESPKDCQTCFYCWDLNAGFYLGGMRVFGNISHSTYVTYPSCNRTVRGILGRKACPLCRLVCRSIATKTKENVETLDPQTTVSFRYVRADSLPKSHDHLHTPLTQSMLNGVQLLLEVSIQSLGVVMWIHALALKQPAFDTVPLSLQSESKSSESSGRTEISLDASIAYDWNLKLVRDELEDLLHDLSSKSFMAGREIRDTISIDLIARWFDLCDAHGDRCKPEPLCSPTENVIWMIDIKARRLVSDFKESDGYRPKFAALSYVWGGEGVQQLKYTSKNGVDARLKSPGGLGDQWNDIPLTIKDAMLLCERLRIPYLWVDAICLGQDLINTDSDMSSQLMEIYQSAYVTIVCAAGKDSWAGLPGIRPHSRHTQRSDIEQVQGRWLGVYLGSSYQLISKTKWNTRAWTYQEMLLSKRLLVFTDEEVLYECDSGGAWRESIFAEHPDLPPRDFTFPLARSAFKLRLDEIVKPPDFRPRNFESLDDSPGEGESSPPEFTPVSVFGLFTGLLDEYLTRQMTYPSDALRAIQGVLSWVERKTGQAFPQGLPSGLFYECLLFDVPRFSPELRRDGYPSWAWCGWNTRQDKGESPINFWKQIELQWIKGYGLISRATGDQEPRMIREHRGEHREDEDSDEPHPDSTKRIHSWVHRSASINESEPVNLLRSAFPHGAELIDRSSTGLQNGFQAVIDSMTASFPEIEPPTIQDLDNILQSQEFQDDNKEVLGTNDHIRQVGATLNAWADVHYSLNIQLGCLNEGNTAQLVPNSKDQDTDRIIVWVYHDNHEDTDEDSSAPAHFSGLRPLTAPARDNSLDKRVVVFREILAPGLKDPKLDDLKIECSQEWTRNLENIIVLWGNSVRVLVSREGEEVKESPNERRYEVIFPNVGFQSIELDAEWRQRQADELEFVRIASTSASSSGKEPNGFRGQVIMQVSTDGKGGAGAVARPAGWETHQVERVITLLIETDAHGLSRRTGLYKIEQKYWDDAPKTERLVYLC